MSVRAADGADHQALYVDQSTAPGPADRTVAAALAGSAAASAAMPAADGGPRMAAALAWRWVVGTDALDLYAVDAAVPHWRATCVGGGGALHRARVALAAEGLVARITLLPDVSERGRGGPPDTTHLARLVVAGSIKITQEARALYDATDPDLVDGQRDRAPSRRVIRDLAGAARAEGVRLRLIRDGGDVVGVLHGPNTREAWVRAGMALSAVRLLAHRHGLATEAAVATDPWGRPIRTGRRRIGDREGWLGVGIGTAYVRLRLTPA